MVESCGGAVYMDPTGVWCCQRAAEHDGPCEVTIVMPAPPWWKRLLCGLRDLLNRHLPPEF